MASCLASHKGPNSAIVEEKYLYGTQRVFSRTLNYEMRSITQIHPKNDLDRLLSITLINSIFSILPG